MKRPISRFLILASVAGLAACAGTKASMKSGSQSGAAANGGAAEAAPQVPPTQVTEASLRVGDFVPREDLKTVHFDYDSAKLSPETLKTLKANAEVLKADPSLVVEVTGNCDARGTVAYNLALGQRRAKEVRDYYILLGVDGTRVATISYGKEKPLCEESTPACWARNRRAETLARVPPPAAAAPAATSR
ncbi:MAG: OmpA family protein [Elusimicrobia bacterium]|nr:OmpA family protein [Elusimicrobiota bacterium]